MRTGKHTFGNTYLEPASDAAICRRNARLKILNIRKELARRVIRRLPYVGEAELVPAAKAQAGADTLLQLRQVGACLLYTSPSPRD